MMLVPDTATRLPAPSTSCTWGWVANATPFCGAGSGAVVSESAAAAAEKTAENQKAIDRANAVTAVTTGMIAKFRELTKAGDTSSEAINKIGKDFNLATVPGIQNAGVVLNTLLRSGEITAVQFKEAFSKNLAGINLSDFSVNAKKAFDIATQNAEAAARQVADAIALGFDTDRIKQFEREALYALGGAKKAATDLQINLDAGLRETVKRAGLDFDVIAGGMSAASKSAIDDTNVMIKGLDRLKAQGVDTAQALSASLGKAINTADSEKALEAVKTQIEQVRSKLGDKVADGLLDQAKTKALELKDALDQALPGIQNAREAMKQLGVTSDTEFKAIATKSKAAFDMMKESGTGSARELSEAFKKVATDAIAANGGIAPEWVKTEAAVRGVTIAVDANGKATVENAQKSIVAISDLNASYSVQSEAMDRLMLKYTMSANYTERQIALLEREAAAAEKAAAAENKRLGVDKDKFSVDANGNRISQSIDTRESVFNQAKGQGLTDAQADQIARQFISDNGQAQGYGQADTRRGENFYTELQKAIDRLKENRNSNANSNAGSQNNTSNSNNASNNNTAVSTNSTANQKSSESPRIVNVQIGSASYPVQTNAQGADNLIKALQIGARNAGFAS